MNAQSKRSQAFLPFVFLGLFVAGCVVTPVTGRKAFILTSEEEEIELGNQAFQEILAKEKKLNDPRAQEILARVGKRIADAAKKPSYRWEFHVLESPDANAFALPGGKVAVTSTMMRFVANEAQLAAVVGHEVAHATARHGGQRMTIAMGTEMGFAALQLVMGGPMTAKKQLLLQALGLGAKVGAELPFSRAHESEADQIGLVYMAEAGYLPPAAVDFWREFGKRSSGPPEFLSTHPSGEHRMQDLANQIASVMPTYQQSPQYGLGTPMRALAE